MRVLIAGASGFVGSRLAQRLAADGHQVVAVARRIHGVPDTERIMPVSLDIADRAATAAALDGIGCAYYLVHSLAEEGGFSARDRDLALRFAQAGADAELGRIVYLGGLGSGPLSEHLRSRQEVGDALRSTGIDVVELRAAVVIGSGSVSFEMMRYLVERLPAMVCPRWVRSPIQPVAIADVLAYLVEAAEAPPGVYEIGGEVTTYREMMQRYADVRGLPRRAIVDVPVLTLNLSSYWVDLVTPVDTRVSHSLIESLSVPVVVSDPEAAARAFSVRPRDVTVAIREALDEQADAVDESLPTMPVGLHDGVYVIRSTAQIEPAQAKQLRDDLATIGGDMGWYGIPRAWRLRFVLGDLIGERHALRRAELTIGAGIDWWHVVAWDGSTLVLRADGWRLGEGWLAFDASSDDRFALTAAWRPRGALGFLYWRLLEPLHRWGFHAMMRHRLRRAR